MTNAQAVVADTHTHAMFLIAKVNNPADNRGVADICKGFPALLNEVAKRDADADLTGTVSFGHEFWTALSPDRKPEGFEPLQEIQGPVGKMPSTGGDLMFHIRCQRFDLIFEVAHKLWSQFGGKVTAMDETHCFRYLESRDLTGFIDGTENPEGENRAKVALIDSGEFAGGSLVFAQRFVHDLKKWEALSQDAQEHVFGRTKKDSTQLPSDENPLTAHIRRAVFMEDGEEVQILRQSLPYGQASGDAGLFFVAYSKRSDVYHVMLRRMFGVVDDIHDHLMDYTKPVSGAIFFCPSLDTLAAL